MTNTERRIQNLYDRVNEQAVAWRRKRGSPIAKTGFRILCGPPRRGKPMVVSPKSSLAWKC